MTRFTIVVLAGCAAACSGSGPEGPGPAHEAGAVAESPAATAGNPEPVQHSNVGELPFAQGRRFESLEAYLAFLEERGKTDVPWYREVKPGLYELVSRRGPRTAPRYFTRAELLRKFGFTDPP